MKRRMTIALSAIAIVAAVLAVPEMGDFDLRKRNADELASLAADHLPVRDVLPQVLPDLAPHNLLESLQVSINAAGHDGTIPNRRHFAG